MNDNELLQIRAIERKLHNTVKMNVVNTLDANIQREKELEECTIMLEMWVRIQQLQPKKERDQFVKHEVDVIMETLTDEGKDKLLKLLKEREQ